ncbi:MAG: hypothetical protein F6J90_36540 [Moorea sp. SIOASIH]|uniref:hypothetical protein n=1 Tax=Moorena sp. SIOASIH TaxID=2607817 RepID=UPI0013BAA934|nr:hypothetical protein [Moorena sp. SIOASIH]NEO41544.1 hypothetical protein [Moorena sp. SIOASIH]
MEKNNSVTMELLDKKKRIHRIGYNEAYKFWQAEWNIAIKDIGLEGLSVKISDKFIAADEILVFREGHNIAALGLINYLDFNLDAYKDISYFKAMTEESMDFIVNNGYNKIMISTYNIVGKQYRRVKVGNTIMAIALPGVVLKILQYQPDLDLGLGMPLIPSANHRTLSRLGMTNLPGGLITIHNVQAQFMYVNQGDVNLGKYDAGISSLFANSKIAA